MLGSCELKNRGLEAIRDATEQDQAGEGGSAVPRIAAYPPAASIGSTASLLDRVAKHERGNADDECSGDEFENAHSNLLAAVQYEGHGESFKTGGFPESWNISWNKCVA